MNLFNTKTPIEPANPQVLDYIKQRQNNQALTLADNKNYILLTTCLFEAILNEYSNNLLPRDIIFFVQLLNLYNSALSKNQKSIIYSSENLAKLLGYNAKDKNNMRSIVLRRIKKLEELELLKVIRSKDKKGSDKVNELIPILPNHLYDKLKYAQSNFNLDSRRLTGESNIQHILRTKLFTPIDLTFMKSLFDNATITATQKLFYLNCIITAYKNYQVTGQLSFVATSKELMSKNNVSKRTLARILNYIKNQYPDYFIEVNHSYSKSYDIDSNRYDKSIFIISINPLVIPKSFINKNKLEVQNEIEQTKTVEKKVEYRNIANAPLDADNETKKPDTYACFQAGVPKKQPRSAKKAAYNNKGIIKKESNKNIDENIDKNLDEKNEELDTLEKNNQLKPQTFSQTSDSEHLESELCSLSSKSLKNIFKDFIDALPSPSNNNAENASSTIQDISDKKNKINIPNKCNTVIHKKKSTQSKAINDRKHCRQHKDLRYFYPLSEKDANMLNFKANREFSTNFTNQLLLKLYIKYPSKRFKNRFTFLSYMVQILANEKHQGPLVNHTSFRFSCNIDEQEKRVLECEQYLIKVESSSGTCKISQVKKKIAGRFSSEVAYKILTGVEFKTNAYNSVITVLIPSSIELSERQIEILSEQLEAVYGMNGYYIQEVEEETIQHPKSRTSDIHTQEIPLDIFADGSKIKTTKDNTSWHQIRKGIIEELGKAIDAVWFSKAKAIECRETSLLLLTMPTRFMADWVRNNYSHAIRRLAGSVGVKMVEYEYEQNNRV